MSSNCLPKTNPSPGLSLIAQLRDDLSVSDRSIAAAFFMADLQARCHGAALDNGWWDKRRKIVEICERHSADLGSAAKAQIRIANLGLISSEAGEAMDNCRKNLEPDDHLPEHPGAAVELADVVIRAFDMAGAEGWNLGQIILRKLEHNVKRGYMHGGKLA